MKKIFALLLFLCFTAGAHAQLLWRISGKDLARPSYVFGTHHLAPCSIVDSVAGFHQALHDVDRVVGEVVMADMMHPDTLSRLQSAMLLPASTTLRDLYSAPRYDTVAVAVKQLLGVDLKALERMTPAALSTQVSMVLALKSIPGFDPRRQLDSWVQTQAASLGKKIGGLESVEFQIGTLYRSQSLERQAEQLYAMITHTDLAQELVRDLTRAYMDRDLDRVGEQLTRRQNTAADPLPEEEERLIYGRNRQWADAMPRIMTESPTLFVVGCGHLPGDRGLLHLLREAGYRVEAVR